MAPKRDQVRQENLVLYLQHSNSTQSENNNSLDRHYTLKHLGTSVHSTNKYFNQE